MKFLISIIVAFAVLQNVRGYSSDLSDREFMKQISMKDMQGYMSERSTIQTIRSKINEVCPGYGNKFENVTMEIVKCTETIQEDQETQCSLIKNHFKRCLNPLTSMFEECLPTKAKQLPSMLVDMFVATTNYLCKTDGEHIFELGNACVRHPNEKATRCIRRIATQFQQYQRKETLPSAADICDLFESLRPCFQSHLIVACGHPITRETYLELYDVALKSCKKYENNDIELVAIEAS